MRRREFIAGLGVAATLPLVARAQQSTVPVVGILGSTRAEGYASSMAAFMQGLKEAGFVPGQNVVLEQRWANDQYDHLPEMAADFVRAKVSLIAAIGNNLPIRGGGDPVEIGLVASLNRPGGNITGVTQQSIEVFAKRLELLHEMVPSAGSIALLTNPTNKLNAEDETREAEKAARVHGVRLVVLRASSLSDLDMAFARLVKERAGGLLVSSDPFFVAKRDEVVALAARHAVPAIYHRREFTVAGGLTSYGPSLAEAAWQVGVYYRAHPQRGKTCRPPVQRPTRFEMVINLKTARTLGIDVPTSILLRADEVIE